MKKDKVHKFYPRQIIFSVTDNCNLNCPHCFVKRTGNSLNIEKAKKLILDCCSACADLDFKTYQPDETQWSVGFSGGEPFLNIDFLCKISSFCVENNVMFDRIMTNALWWQDKIQLKKNLNKLYESGYDGKIGISFDTFHNSSVKKIAEFCITVYEVWQNPAMIEIQTTYEKYTNTFHTIKKQKKLLKDLATELGGKYKKNSIYSNNLENYFFIRVDFNLRSFKDSCKDSYKDYYEKNLEKKDLKKNTKNPAWQHKTWFKEDYCQGPGNIFYVHCDGNVAPCCGYANEHPSLFIGNINNEVFDTDKDDKICTHKTYNHKKDSECITNTNLNMYQTLMENAEKNAMVKNCFTIGLEKKRKELKKNKIKFPGKTKDICMFCSWLCNKVQ